MSVSFRLLVYESFFRLKKCCRKYEIQRELSLTENKGALKQEKRTQRDVNSDEKIRR